MNRAHDERSPNFADAVRRIRWFEYCLPSFLGVALAGIALKAIGGVAIRRFSIVLYLAMGWCALIAIVPLWRLVPAWGLFWIIAGGLGYSVGVPFLSSDEHIRFNHLQWHLFMVAGRVCHFIAVAGYAA